jgi:hypothetical protein
MMIKSDGRAASNKKNTKKTQKMAAEIFPFVDDEECINMQWLVRWLHREERTKSRPHPLDGGPRKC